MYAAAQSGDPNAAGARDVISRGDRRVMRAQVELGMKLALQARETLETGAGAMGFERAEALTKKSYVFLRFAMHGVELLLNQSDLRAYDGRLLKMALTAINQAREHNL